MNVLDIERNVIAEGQEVLYARKRNYTANGELVRATVTKVSESGNVSMKDDRGRKLLSTRPDSQIIVLGEVRRAAMVEIGNWIDLPDATGEDLVEEYLNQ